jgi:hypothetical protein
MSEEHHSAPAGASASLRPDVSAPPGPDTPAPTRPGAPAPLRPRTRLVWLFTTLSLLPGLAAATARELWSGLPDAVRWTSYGLSGLLIVAAVGLIVGHKE